MMLHLNWQNLLLYLYRETKLKQDDSDTPRAASETIVKFDPMPTAHVEI